MRFVGPRVCHSNCAGKISSTRMAGGCLSTLSLRLQCRNPRGMTTVIVRSVIKTGKIVLPPSNCVRNIQTLYSGCKVLLVYSRIVTNFCQAKGTFTFVGFSVGPSVVAFTGNIAYNCIRLKNYVMDGTITRCFRRRILRYKLACDNRALTYTTNITTLACCGRRSVRKRITGVRRVMTPFVSRVMGGRGYVNRTEYVKLFKTLRIMGGGRAERPVRRCKMPNPIVP